MKFVKINGVIYDYSSYKLNLSNLLNSINEEIENSIVKYGFIKQKENVFYNKKFDLMITFATKNRSKLKFV